MFINVGHFRHEDATPLEVVLWRGCDCCHLQAVTIMINRLWHDIPSGQGLVFGWVVKKAQRTLHDNQCYQSSDKLQWRSQQPIFGFVLENQIVFLKINWLFAGCVVVLEKHPQISWLVFFFLQILPDAKMSAFWMKLLVFFLHCRFCMKKIKCSIQVQCKEEEKS